jgi:hypothetical protein
MPKTQTRRFHPDIDDAQALSHFEAIQLIYQAVDGVVKLRSRGLPEPRADLGRTSWGIVVTGNAMSFETHPNSVLGPWGYIPLLDPGAQLAEDVSYALRGAFGRIYLRTEAVPRQPGHFIVTSAGGLYFTSPTLELFSERGLAQADAVSYWHTMVRANR